MPILAAGPFNITQTPETGVLIRAHLRPQGDWAGTDEGRAELKRAQSGIETAVVAGKLPPGSRIEATPDNDLKVIVVPMKTWDEAQKAKDAVRDEIIAATGAVKTENIPWLRSATGRDNDSPSR